MLAVGSSFGATDMNSNNAAFVYRGIAQEASVPLRAGLVNGRRVALVVSWQVF